MKLFKNKNIRFLKTFYFLIFIILFIIFYFLFFKNFNNKPTKKDVLKYLDNNLKEEYLLKKDTNKDNYDMYQIYLVDSNINVNVVCKEEYNDAINKRWTIKINDYFENKFLSLSKKREQLRQLKYPNIKEEIIYTKYSSYNKIQCINIYINNLDNSKELYDYLMDIYKLNDFKYYNSYSFTNGIKEQYWQDFININCYIDNDFCILHTYFSKLRKNEYYVSKYNNDLISYEEFNKKLKKDSFD